MKNLAIPVFQFAITLFIVLNFNACKKATTTPSGKVLALNEPVTTTAKKAVPLSQEFKSYWYAGNAELTSYKLVQARYGELREGHATLIYVTEEFLPKIQVKADYPNATNVPVLKLNAVKKFNTGIYPYSIMQSTFYPVANNQHAIKVSSSMQEWCGHVYTQLNNKSQFEVVSHSYFQGEADQTLKLNKSVLENELWAQLRIDPSSLPTGEISCIPAFEFIRLKHKPVKAFKATATLTKNSYKLYYPELNRTLLLYFEASFPYQITGWEETFNSGGKQLKTTATKLKSIKSPYWSKNQNKDEILRDSLLLH